jgi:hypothetical protein
VISCYRSPVTNAILRSASGGVARGSLHVEGRAIDVRLTDVSSAVRRQIEGGQRRCHLDFLSAGHSGRIPRGHTIPRIETAGPRDEESPRQMATMELRTRYADAMKRRPKETDAPRADPDIDENGVDRAQIRAMLQLTPEERLLRVEEFIQSMIEIRELNEERPVR